MGSPDTVQSRPIVVNSLKEPGIRLPLWQDRLRSWSSFYAVPFFAVYGLTIAVYSYFFTTPLFTCHTFPNIYIFPYPSYTTTIEGRWFGDLIIRLLGGSGVQSFQMFVATALQVVNGFLFADFLKVRGKGRIFLTAAFLSWHPAFLDYYCYSIVHIPFVTSDFLSLLGILALDRMPSRRAGANLATALFILAIATYQTKVALISLLLLVWCIQGTCGWPDVPGKARECLRRMLIGGAVFGAAMGLYFLSAKLVLKGTHLRTHTNDSMAVLKQIAAAYPEAYARFTSRVDYLPGTLWWLPAAAIALGVTGCLMRTRNLGRGLIVLGLLALMPISLRMTSIINDNTFDRSGRIVTAHAYFLLFFLHSAWMYRATRYLAALATGLLVYFFAIMATQETNAAVMKHIFDVERVNRLVARMEETVPDLYSKTRSLVVIGSQPFELQKRMKAPNNWYGSRVTVDFFQPYRQTSQINFFLGKKIFESPTKTEIKAAIESSKARQPWPAPDSVYLQGNTVVVLLQAYAPGMPVTWPE